MLHLCRCLRTVNNVGVRRRSRSTRGGYFETMSWREACSLQTEKILQDEKDQEANGTMKSSVDRSRQISWVRQMGQDPMGGIMVPSCKPELPVGLPN